MPQHPSLFRSKKCKQKWSSSTSMWAPSGSQAWLDQELGEAAQEGNQRLHFCKKLEPFHINPKPTVESVICYNRFCFFNSLRKVHAAKLQRVTEIANRLTGSEVVDGEAHYERKALKRFRAILADAGHQLNEELETQISVREVSVRSLSLETRTNRYCYY